MSIQQLRRDHGWTQEQLAQHSGLSVRTIQRIERGDAATLETLKCLAAVFETNVSRLIQEQKMNQSMSEEKNGFTEHREREAIEYVNNLKGFYVHCIVFAVVMPCLTVFNLWVSPDKIWIGWVAVPWALAIGLHAILMFGTFSLFGANWEQRIFEKRMRDTEHYK